MARKQQQKKGTAQDKGGSQSTSKRTSKQTTPQRRRAPGESQGLQESADTLLDEKTRRDIIGVIFIVIAVVLMILAVMPQDGALVSGALSMGLHLTFGVGCYLLPIVLFVIGMTFLVKFERQRVPLRAAIGLSIIFIALLGFIALFAPISVLGIDDPDMLFSERALEGYGGYIGSGLAWIGVTLFGRVVTGVILVGVMIVGFLVIGFSISRLIETINVKRLDLGAHRLGDPSRPSSSAGFARIRKGSPGAGAHEFGYPMPDQVPFDYDPQMTAALGDGYAAMRPAPVAPVASFAPARAGRGRVDISPLQADQMTRPLRSSEIANVDPVYDDRDDFRPRAFEEDVLEDDFYEEDSYEDDSFEEDVFEGERIPLKHLTVDSPIMVEPLEPTSEPGPEPKLKSNNPRKSRELRRAKAAEESVIAEAAPAGAVEVPIVIEPAPEVGLPVEEEPPAKPTKPVKASKKSAKASLVPTPQEGFVLPDMSLLEASSPKAKSDDDRSELAEVAAHLQQVIGEFGINAEVVDWIAGPTVTLFEVDLPAGVRVSRIIALSDDIALALASPGVRIFAPVPGTNYVGIEVPNAKRETVLLADVLEDAPPGPLQIAIGKDVEGNSIVSDLAKMPHLLIGGTTGSGKSVAINAMIMSILMRATPSEVRFIMIDPKRVEFTPYNGIPHLYVPVVTEPKEAASALSWGVAEMERRLKIFSKVGARNIAQYNAKAQADRLEREAAAKEGASEEEQAAAMDEPMEEMPYIVIIIDELADLMMNVGKEVELSISRIAQLARAAGIHLIVATQRPSTNVVTGLIKANITNRIAFNVASGIDSRVILDAPGAESLIGLGDLLLSKPELAKPQRIQACYVTEDEINRVVDFVKEQSDPEYHSDILKTNLYTIGATDPSGGSAGGDCDPLLWEAAEIVVSSNMGSTSNIQRRLKVGYARAGRIMDQLEEKGIVGPANGSRPREVLVDEMELETVKAFETADGSD